MKALKAFLICILFVLHTRTIKISGNADQIQSIDSTPNKENNIQLNDQNDDEQSKSKNNDDESDDQSEETSKSIQQDQTSDSASVPESKLKPQQSSTIPNKIQKTHSGSKHQNQDKKMKDSEDQDEDQGQSEEEKEEASGQSEEQSYIQTFDHKRHIIQKSSNAEAEKVSQEPQSDNSSWWGYFILFGSLGLLVLLIIKLKGTQTYVGKLIDEVFDKIVYSIADRAYSQKEGYIQSNQRDDNEEIDYGDKVAVGYNEKRGRDLYWEKKSVEGL